MWRLKEKHPPRSPTHLCCECHSARFYSRIHCPSRVAFCEHFPIPVLYTFLSPSKHLFLIVLKPTPGSLQMTDGLSAWDLQNKSCWFFAKFCSKNHLNPPPPRSAQQTPQRTSLYLWLGRGDRGWWLYRWPRAPRGSHKLLFNERSYGAT